jgi:hypothetical protein
MLALNTHPHVATQRLRVCQPINQGWLIYQYFQNRVFAYAQWTGAVTRESLRRDRLDGLTSPAFHACGSASPFRARFCHRNNKISRIISSIINACCCVFVIRVQFDKQASMFIPTNTLREFVRILPEPMGFGAAVDQAVPETAIKEFIGMWLCAVTTSSSLLCAVLATDVFRGRTQAVCVHS